MVRIRSGSPKHDFTNGLPMVGWHPKCPNEPISSVSDRPFPETPEKIDQRTPVGRRAGVHPPDFRSPSPAQTASSAIPHLRLDSCASPEPGGQSSTYWLD